MPVRIKTKEDIAIIREGGIRLSRILSQVIKEVRAGVSTYDLDMLAERLVRESGGIPAFKGYRIKEVRTPYPATICASVNDEVVHSIPRKEKILKEGDMIGIDIGMQWPNREIQNPKPKTQNSVFKIQNSGLFTDMARTIGVGKISQDAERLIRATEEALAIGIRTVRPGARVGDIGHAIEMHLKKEKLGIIRDLAGHGVGYALHEEPLIPNYGSRGTGMLLQEGMVIAIEPMATLGGWKITLDRDEWTFRTADGSLAAHFEDTVAVTKEGVEILTHA